MHYPSNLLSGILNMSEGRLYDLAVSADTAYHRFPIRKRSGKLRWIDSPNALLKTCQRDLLEKLLYQLPVNAAAHGFVPGRSILTNATCHVGQAWVIVFDLKDFFPSVTRAQVDEGIRTIPRLTEVDYDVLGRLLTKNGVLPQGAPTSPYMANLVFKSADNALGCLADDAGLRYTRYADDLTFSGPYVPAKFFVAVREVVCSHGFRLNDRKTRRMGRHTRQAVTGLVVNERVQLPRPLRRWLRVVRHDVSRRSIGKVQLDFPELTRERLEGYLALTRMVEYRPIGGCGTRYK